MNDVVTIVEAPQSRQVAMDVGAAGARLLGCRSRTVTVGVRGSDAVVEVARATLADPHVDALVLAGTPEGAPSWRIITEATKPVFVVPTGSRSPSGGFRRVLLPLDGGPAATAAAAAVVRRMAPDTVILATHVFSEGTVPAFWDQAAHAGVAWGKEFVARNLPAAADLRLCRGDPAAEVVAQADECGADLLVLGWAQQLTGSRAKVVRRALAGRVPVLLVGAVAGEQPGRS
ncbi:universal stress protein [Nocardioides daeguensis]|uniref:UspA domain-containing protein n=1 Tax=Nocardioides daeguensis TaxID=908359 RepID=A0ABP6UU90_9ACTN|nr:universal stress protein [Nocardioides daeguensis]MBV6728347.1 universal stress protein [Nocardioides daeguensis]MCR1773156.1 universal stress protein [Nocardioides daeguensis]